MNTKYMLDTNICIYLMKHQPPEVRLLVHKLPRPIAQSAQPTKTATEMLWINSSHLMQSL